MWLKQRIEDFASKMFKFCLPVHYLGEQLCVSIRCSSMKMLHYLQLTNVEFIGKNLFIEPKVSSDYSITKIVVSDQAANAQVGFDSTMAHVQDSE